jgi:hypothetical protein
MNEGSGGLEKKEELQKTEQKLKIATEKAKKEYLQIIFDEVTESGV